MIVAVTGGRDMQPTPAELAALFGALRRRRARVLRVGCARGVDAAVLEAARRLELGLGWELAALRLFVIERWVADWHNETGRMPGEPRGGVWPSAGPMRNRAMLTGDVGLVERVECTIPSAGTADALVYWPGGRGTKDCREQAARLGVRWVVPIEDLKEQQ